MAQHVLIVDDDAARQRSLAQELRALAVDEVAAPSGARERAAACRAAFDVIVEELHVPATGESAGAMQRGNGPRQRGS